MFSWERSQTSERPNVFGKRLSVAQRRPDILEFVSTPLSVLPPHPQPVALALFIRFMGKTVNLHRLTICLYLMM